MYYLGMGGSVALRDVAGSGAQRIAVEDLPSHLATLESELSGGRAIELVRGETVIAELHAPKPVELKPQADMRREMPDFMGRMRKIWGDEMLPEGTSTRWIREDRDARG